MRVTLLITVGVALGALSLAGCEPPRPHHHADAGFKTIEALTCPDSAGDLTRKSQSEDGKTCDYSDNSGTDVTLQLVGLDGQDAKAALSPIETALKAELPAGTGPKSAGAGDGGNDADRVDIDLPGVHIHASGKDNAKIDVGGSAARDSGSATIDAPGVHINADDQNAQININESGKGVRISYILAASAAGPHGYKAVGYEARGPSGGPLAVVTVRSKSDHADRLREDAQELLKLNVGG